jgi:hypothetical protein
LTAVSHQLKHRLIDKLRVKPLEARMLRGRPIQHQLGEFLDAHAAVRRRYDREQTLLALRGQGFHVMFEQCLGRRLRIPGAAAPSPSRDQMRKASWK